jgi:hypothetical protein
MVYKSMTTLLAVAASLSDAALLTQVTRLAGRERETTAELIAFLAELDSRRLYLGAGCSSLFTYCTQILHLSEHAAYGRIEAARAARRFPVIVDAVAEGALTLTAVCLLVPVLTEGNHLELLAAARFKSKRDVEQLVARARPQPGVPSSVRKLPSSRPVVQEDNAAHGHVTASRTGDGPHALLAAPQDPGPTAAPACTPSKGRPSKIRQLAPERYKVVFTMSREMHDKLRRAQDLLRHSIPNGDAAAIFDRALTLLVENLEKKKVAAVSCPRPGRSSSSSSRHVPAAVRREVWSRDQGQCAFVGTRGRCAERGMLEFHHVVPFTAGGQTTVNNLQLRCRAHNAYEAELSFGPRVLREVRAPYEAATRSGPSSQLTKVDRGRGKCRVTQRRATRVVGITHLDGGKNSKVPDQARAAWMSDCGLYQWNR